ncbi:hypothetical protein PGIGA_G00216050 [Pangasianodon gigas]|uniref:Uncharacterized protein n=1 Tax=Pangasianodon gigas TaxID=30993 RepID=A0ACC5WHC3_PANGG|nr:hypothetical protein [Pangasianodon gigas]
MNSVLTSSPRAIFLRVIRVPFPFSLEAHEACTCQLKVISKLIMNLMKNKQKHSRSTMVPCFCSATDHRPG